ncbi:putative HNHc nuclease [Selenomonas sp. TAMA-11512]|uniref:putative HNHc nuclease n=1 Tax=Selenomonas sp. TAMA-11512 TaxID=3095337 RepID=UPI0030D31BC3
MIQEHMMGAVKDIMEDGTAVIHAALPSLDRALLREYRSVEIILPDGRRISPEQRRKVYALIGEVAEYVDGIRNAGTIESAKRTLKMEFMLSRMEGMERRLFSLSNCDVTTAREFINFLVDFIIENDIPTHVPLIENCEDVARYVYSCLINKKCAVCGRKAELHHVDAVGMGRNRKEICHIGMRALPLCREHHIEIHSTGREDFLKKYILEPVQIDERIAKVYRLKGR